MLHNGVESTVDNGWTEWSTYFETKKEARADQLSSLEILLPTCHPSSTNYHHPVLFGPAYCATPRLSPSPRPSRVDRPLAACGLALQLCTTFLQLGTEVEGASLFSVSCPRYIHLMAK